MEKKYWTGIAVLAAALAWLTMVMPAAVSAQPTKEMSWEQEAEMIFFLPKGRGGQLMTHEEWGQHLQEMLGMTREKRNKYRKEWHNKLMEQAKERGLDTPVPPEPELKIPGVD